MTRTVSRRRKALYIEQPKISGKEIAQGVAALVFLVGINLAALAAVVWVIVAVARWAWGA